MSTAASQGRSVFLSNYPSTWTDKIIADKFCVYGKILEIRRGGNKNCVFIDFDRRVDALDAVTCQRGRECSGMRLCVEIAHHSGSSRG